MAHNTQHFNLLAYIYGLLLWPDYRSQRICGLMQCRVGRIPRTVLWLAVSGAYCHHHLVGILCNKRGSVSYFCLR